MSELYVRQKNMKYTATAIKGDIAIWASMPSTSIKYVTGNPVEVPTSKKQWVNIPAGQSVPVGLVLGIHPDCLPDNVSKTIQGVKMIHLEGYSAQSLPQYFHEVLHLESIEE